MDLRNYFYPYKISGVHEKSNHSTSSTFLFLLDNKMVEMIYLFAFPFFLFPPHTPPPPPLFLSKHIVSLTSITFPQMEKFVPHNMCNTLLCYKLHKLREKGIYILFSIKNNITWLMGIRKE